MGILPMGSDSEITGPACGVPRSEAESDETTLSFRYVWRGWERGQFRTGRMALPATPKGDETASAVPLRRRSPGDEPL